MTTTTTTTTNGRYTIYYTTNYLENDIVKEVCNVIVMSLQNYITLHSFKFLRVLRGFSL